MNDDRFSTRSQFGLSCASTTTISVTHSFILFCFRRLFLFSLLFFSLSPTPTRDRKKWHQNPLIFYFFFYFFFFFGLVVFLFDWLLFFRLLSQLVRLDFSFSSLPLLPPPCLGFYRLLIVGIEPLHLRRSSDVSLVSVALTFSSSRRLVVDFVGFIGFVLPSLPSLIADRKKRPQVSKRSQKEKWKIEKKEENRIKIDISTRKRRPQRPAHSHSRRQTEKEPKITAETMDHHPFG